MIVPGGSDYGKIRPAVVVQADAVTRVWNSVVVCPVTSHLTKVDTFARVNLEPSTENGLQVLSQVMVDKITTYPMDRVRGPIGKIDNKSIETLNVSLVLMHGLWSQNQN